MCFVACRGFVLFVFFCQARVSINSVLAKSCAPSWRASQFLSLCCAARPGAQHRQRGCIKGWGSACMHVFAYVCVNCKHVSVCKCRYVYMQAFMDVCMSVCLFVCTFVCVGIWFWVTTLLGHVELSLAAIVADFAVKSHPGGRNLHALVVRNRWAGKCALEVVVTLVSCEAHPNTCKSYVLRDIHLPVPSISMSFAWHSLAYSKFCMRSTCISKSVGWHVCEMHLVSSFSGGNRRPLTPGPQDGATIACAQPEERR